MKKSSDSPAVPPQASALDRVVAAFETAKTKVKEANEALALVAVAVKEALKEDKQRRQEVESVHAGLSPAAGDQGVIRITSRPAC